MTTEFQNKEENIIYFTSDSSESNPVFPVKEFPSLEEPSDLLVNSINTVDFLEIQEELLTFKTEIREELEKHKEILKSFKEVFTTLKQSHDMLQLELKQKRQEQKAEKENQEQALLRPLLLEIIEIRDRIETGLDHYRSVNVSFWRRLLKQDDSLLKSLKEGHSMTLRRLDQLLYRFDVTPIQTINNFFDPRSMRAVAIDSCPGMSDGQVTQEFRKGYVWKDEILRTAEVKVNKEGENK